MIWKPMGKRQRKGDRPPSTKLRPYSSQYAYLSVVVGVTPQASREVWTDQDDTTDVECELDRDELFISRARVRLKTEVTYLASRSMSGGLGRPDRYDGVQDTRAEPIDETSCRSVMQSSSSITCTVDIPKIIHV